MHQDHTLGHVTFHSGSAFKITHTAKAEMCTHTLACLFQTGLSFLCLDHAIRAIREELRPFFIICKTSPPGLLSLCIPETERAYDLFITGQAQGWEMSTFTRFLLSFFFLFAYKKPQNSLEKKSSGKLSYGHDMNVCAYMHLKYTQQQSKRNLQTLTSTEHGASYFS